MAYASWTKGSTALLLNARALAESAGVGSALEAEWELSQRGLAQRCAQAPAGNGPKAWRFVGEMSEIAKTFDEAGLPGDFHRGAAEVYGRLAPLRGRETNPPNLEEALTLMTRLAKKPRL